MQKQLIFSNCRAQLLLSYIDFRKNFREKNNFQNTYFRENLQTFRAMVRTIFASNFCENAKVIAKLKKSIETLIPGNFNTEKASRLKRYFFSQNSNYLVFGGAANSCRRSARQFFNISENVGSS